MKPLNILVIDDERVICDACEMVLAEKGHSVVSRTDGQSGLDTIRKDKFDIVLLDMKLPDMDGMKILKTVQNSDAMPRIIVMTGYSSISNAVEAIKKGADNYLAKPFTDDELLDAIEKACGSSC